MKQPFRSEVKAADVGEQRVLDLCPALVAFFRHHLPASRRNDAEDLAQETLIACLLALRGEAGRGIRNLVSYARGVARHKLDDLHRTESRHPTVSLDGPDAGPVRARCQSAVAEERLIEAERRRRLLRCVRQLKPIEREFLRLRVFEEVDNARASSRLGIDAEEGSRVKNRALARLRFLMRAPIKTRDRSRQADS